MRRRRAVLALVLVAVAVAACGRAEGVRDTRRALENAGYRQVEVDLRAGSGIGVARVDTAPGGPAPETAARVIWETLPVTFDQLIVAVGGATTPYSYEELTGRFGPRDPSLDGKQIDEQVVRSGLKLMFLLSAGALLSVGFVVVTALAGVRALKRARASG
jgi:predicted small secreted protein